MAWWESRRGPSSRHGVTPGLEPPAEHGDTFPLPGQTPQGARAMPGARAVVAHLHVEPVGVVAQNHVHGGAARMLERIGEPFLDDTVGVELDAGGQIPWLPLGLYAHGQTG